MKRRLSINIKLNSLGCFRAAKALREDRMVGDHAFDIENMVTGC